MHGGTLHVKNNSQCSACHKHLLCKARPDFFGPDAFAGTAPHPQQWNTHTPWENVGLAATRSATMYSFVQRFFLAQRPTGLKRSKKYIDTSMKILCNAPLLPKDLNSTWSQRVARIKKNLYTNIIYMHVYMYIYIYINYICIYIHIYKYSFSSSQANPRIRFARGPPSGTWSSSLLETRTSLFGLCDCTVCDFENTLDTLW